MILGLRSSNATSCGHFINVLVVVVLMTFSNATVKRFSG